MITTEKNYDSSNPEGLENHTINFGVITRLPVINNTENFPFKIYNLTIHTGNCIFLDCNSNSETNSRSSPLPPASNVV